jgi:hypothetical protein
MFGRLPWLAFERRMRAFFFLVFLDMGFHPTRWVGRRSGQRWLTGTPLCSWSARRRCRSSSQE